RGSCTCRSRAPRKGKYEGGMGSWQHSSWSSAEHVLHCVAGSHSVATAPGSSDRSWRIGLLTSSDPGAVEEWLAFNAFVWRAGERKSRLSFLPRVGFAQ